MSDAQDLLEDAVPILPQDSGTRRQSQQIPSDSESNSIPSLLDITDEDIIKYKPKMPDELKFDFYDAMILFEDGDRDEVSRFLKRIESEVILEREEKPMVVLYDEIGPPAMQPIARLDFSLKRCTYVLLYVTKSFCRDGWTEFSSQTCLMDAISNDDKNWSVVPIFTEPKRKSTYEVPPSIRSLNGIEYWKDDRSYVDKLRKLFHNKLEEESWKLDRKKAEERLKYDRQEWVYRKKQVEAREGNGN